MKNQILNEIKKVDDEVNTPVSFLAQSDVYTISELNAIRIFALNLLSAKMNKEVKKTYGKDYTYNHSFNTNLKNTRRINAKN